MGFSARAGAFDTTPRAMTHAQDHAARTNHVARIIGSPSLESVAPALRFPSARAKIRWKGVAPAPSRRKFQALGIGGERWSYRVAVAAAVRCRNWQHSPLS